MTLRERLRALRPRLATLELPTYCLGLCVSIIWGMPLAAIGCSTLYLSALIQRRWAPRIQPDSYEEIGARALQDESFREGLRAAARVCRAQGTREHPCPSTYVAYYIDRLAAGKMP